MSAEVIHFPKPCPVCRNPLSIVRKISGAWWYECNRCEPLYHQAIDTELTIEKGFTYSSLSGRKDDNE